MILINNFDTWVEVAKKIVRGNEGEVRVSTFNMYMKDTCGVSELVSMLPRSTKFILGTSYSSCTEGCQHCDAQNRSRNERFKRYANKVNMVVTSCHHMKFFSRGDECIVGGFNLSGSNYTDMAICIKGSDVEVLNKNFDEAFNLAKDDGWYIPRVNKPTFTFGKYRNRPVKDIMYTDPSYVQWLLDTLERDRLDALGLVGK